MLLTKQKLFYRLLIGCALISLLTSCVTVMATEITTLPLSVDAPTSTMTSNNLKVILPDGVTPYYLSTLEALYSHNGVQLMWQNQQATKLFEQQLAEMALAGFQPQFAKWIDWLADPAISSMARDVILSDAMLGYLQYVEGVKAQGSVWLYHNRPYKLDIPSVEVVQQWQNSIAGGAIVNFITSLAPQQEQYQAMHTKMSLLLNDSIGWPKINTSATLRPGNTTSAANIAALTEILHHNAVWMGGEAVFKENHKKGATRYSNDLVAGIKDFQRWQGLVADGTIGKDTRNWLNTSPEQRAALLALNIQRLRLLPVKLETNIMVNIPDYTLIYYLDGKPVLESKVIVGRLTRKTPIMDNALINVVVNPPWNVPTKLAREDIMPKIQHDPSYLQRQGIRVYSGWSNDAKPLDPSTIDWSEVSPKNAHFRFQQSPGSSNALGRFKFNMPNSEAIYLHDTPSQHLFNRNVRAISSGCVRVNKAPQLANMLLSEVGWDQQKIANTIKGGKTTHVNLSAQIPVQLYYMTAWITGEDQLQFRNDIYHYDSAAKNGLKSLASIKALLN